MAYYFSLVFVNITTFFLSFSKGLELRSNQGVTEKCYRVSFNVMVRFCSILQKEKKLEKKGKIYELQVYRCDKSADHERVHNRREHFPEFLQSERRLREIAQREISLAAGMDQKSADEQAKITDMLEGLKVDYFIEEIKRERLRSGFIDGSLKRALKLWRSRPYWYLHNTLIDDCADRGGCCGRACGCCRNRELPPTRQSAVGHCTLECICCQRSRDLRSDKIGDKEKERMNKLFPLNPKKDLRYYRKIMLASIYGIKLGSTKNPFDLIDMPPEYKESESNERKY